MGVNKFRRPVMAPGYLDADGNTVSGGAVDSVNGQTGDVTLDIPTVDFATISAIEGDWRGVGVETLGAAILALQGT